MARTIIKSFTAYILFSLFFALPVSAQTGSAVEKRVLAREIYFRFDKADIDINYKSNKEVLLQLDKLIEQFGTEKIDSVVIVTQSSPEGVYEHNIWLAKRRAANIESKLLKRYPTLSGNKIKSSNKGEAWDKLKSYVVKDSLLTDSQKEKILQVLDSKVNLGTKKWRLAQLSSYSDLIKRIYPHLRHSAICFIYYTDEHLLSALPAVAKDQEVGDIIEDLVHAPFLLPIPMAATEIQIEPEPEDVYDDTLAIAYSYPEPPVIPPYRYPVFAFKTNFLTPAMNVGFEVPIGQHWSVGGDWYYPWFWPRKQNDRCFELLGGFVEGRYWFGKNRQKSKRLLGHSIGLYAGGGYYDFEKKYRGMQGEYLDTGIDYKYALGLGGKKHKRWGHLEFSIGFGYIWSSGRTYDVFEPGGQLIGDDNVVKFQFFGPTRAEISLVIPIFHKKEVKP